MDDPNSASRAAPQALPCPDGTRLAYHRSPGRAPGVVFMGGFMSDMTGTKATALEAFCRERGHAYVRFDYMGHGESTGRFIDGTIGRWRDDALAVVDELTEGPQVLVGSSMGGWIMLLAALARPERVAALLGLAVAPDFTEDLIWAKLGPERKGALEAEGVFYEPDFYGEPAPVTRRLIEEGRRHLLLRGPIPVPLPVRLIHGMKDPDVPYRTSIRLAERLESRDVEVTLVKEGEHRLSEPADVARLLRTLEGLLEAVG